MVNWSIPAAPHRWMLQILPLKRSFAKFLYLLQQMLMLQFRWRKLFFLSGVELPLSRCQLCVFCLWIRLTSFGIYWMQRAAIMFRFHSLVERNSEELARLIVAENGLNNWLLLRPSVLIEFFFAAGKNFVEALADIAKGNETVEWATSLPQLAAGIEAYWNFVLFHISNIN